MSSAEKLLQRMRNTKEGWGQRDFDKLYRGFGFHVQEKRERVYFHPEFPSERLIATVARHDSLATGYAVTAVKLIDKLKRLQDEQRENEEEQHRAKQAGDSAGVE